MRRTPFKILVQGGVEMSCSTGYGVIGNGDAVCFFIDPVDRGYINAYTTSTSDCPVVYVDFGNSEISTEIEFTEFPGWRVHATGGGKTIAVALVRRGAE